ncbi:MAG: peptidylprolyl isomerase [Tepidisphaeraceae bacterium]
MKLAAMLTILAAPGLCGCANRNAPTQSAGAQDAARQTPTGGEMRTAEADPVIATLDGKPIVMSQLEKPLIEAYGLNMFMKIAQLDLIRQQAAEQNITVTSADVQAETDRYVRSLFNEDKDPVLRQLTEELEKAERAGDQTKSNSVRDEIKAERARLLDQLLTQQRVSKPDFEMVMETNTYLRKIAEPIVEKSITDDMLQQAFLMNYGEKVQVRHIACANLQEVAEARRRIAAGEPFAQVARELSRNKQSGAVGGELPQFSRNTPGFPQSFKDVAFVLKAGEVSDPVFADNAYHLIKLEARIAPKVVKFEDVKEGVREFVYNTLVENTTRRLRSQLQQKVMNPKILNVIQPELKKQYQDGLSRRESEIRSRDEVRRELERQRLRSSTQPATQESDLFMEPSTEPVPEPTTQPVGPTTRPSS